MISLVAGWVASRRLAPGGSLASAVALALALGLGLLSLVTYAALVAGSDRVRVVLGLEAAALLGACLLPRGEAPAHHRPPRAPLPLLAALALAAAGALLAAGLTLQRFPVGAWDALDIWNYRARVLLEAGLEPALAGAPHADYPLLVPLVVSYAWRLATPSESLSWLLGVACAIAGAALLYGETSLRRGHGAAAAVAGLLLATPWFAFHAASQRADVPLAFFGLGACALLARDARHPGSGGLVAAGALLGAAAWTKNEGLALAAALLGAWLAEAPRRRARRLGGLLLGALPFGVALLHHKLTCGATTDLIAGQGADTLARIADPARWLLVARAFAEGAVFYAAASAALALALRWLEPPRKEEAGSALRFVGLALVAMLAIDFAVYLTTPHDVAWHLGSSIDRVLLQLWPTALLAVVLAAPPRRPRIPGPRPA